MVDRQATSREDPQDYTPDGRPRPLPARLAVVMAGVWLGVLIGLFLTVTALFRADRDVASVAVPVIFERIGRATLVWGGVTLLAVSAATPPGVRRLRGWARWRWGATLTCTVTAVVASATLAVAILPAMGRLRAESVESVAPDAFAALHAFSGVAYAVQAGCVAAMTLLLLLAPADPSNPRPSTEQV